jgi:hypothetical protein
MRPSRPVGFESLNVAVRKKSRWRTLEGERTALRAAV